MVPGRSLADEVERRGTTVSEDADALVLTARRVLCMAAISEAVMQMKPTTQANTALPELTNTEVGLPAANGRKAFRDAAEQTTA